MSFLSDRRDRQAERALERQLENQRRKADYIRGHEQEIVRELTAKALTIRARIERWKRIGPETRVLDVGSGAHGNIFFFGAENAVGIDPLADHYRELFPAWQGRVRTVAASGESLPFEDASFDVVLSDNVLDHARHPKRILEEIARVLAPEGVLFLEVNVHHPFYHLAATAHAGWRSVGIPWEIRPFADHTVHFTPRAARRLFDGLPFRIVEEKDDIEEVKRQGPGRIRHAGDRLKHLFFKNAEYEVIAVREAAR